MTRLKNWWYGDPKGNHAKECLHRARECMAKGQELDLVGLVSFFDYLYDHGKNKDFKKLDDELFINSEIFEKLIQYSFMSFSLKNVVQDDGKIQLISKFIRNYSGALNK